MPLPSITLPDGMTFLEGGHAVDESDVFANSARGTGHSRKRRLYTETERKVSVSLVLTEAQTETFHDWFENTLIVGSLPFVAEVANDEGEGSLFWTAYFEKASLHYEPMPLGMFRVTASLLLTGEGEDSATGGSSGIGGVPFLLDTFTGVAGTELVDHTGETGATWTETYGPTNPFELDGAGGVASAVTYPDGTGQGWVASASVPPSGFYYEVEFTLTSDPGSDVEVFILWGRSTDSNDDFFVIFTFGGGVANIQAFADVDLNATPETATMPTVDLPAGLFDLGVSHTLRIELSVPGILESGKTFTVVWDGYEVGVFSLVSRGVVIDALVFEVGFVDSQVTFDRIEAAPWTPGSGYPPLPP